jgi:hypothetical protein
MGIVIVQIGDREQGRQVVAINVFPDILLISRAHARDCFPFISHPVGVLQ